jgi:hypothetical protein
MSNVTCVWVGLVDLAPRPGVALFEGAPGAFSNALAIANGPSDYRLAVERMFGALGLDVQSIDEVELMSERIGRGDAPEDLVSLSRELSSDNPSCYDTFYVYESTED